MCVWESASLSPMAKPGFLEGNPTDNDEHHLFIYFFNDRKNDTTDFELFA